MPNKIKEHSDNVLLVCGVCLLKPKSGLRNISEEALRRIRAHVFKPYLEPEWDWLPTVICGTCYRALSEAENKVGTTVNHIDYSDLRSPMENKRQEEVEEESQSLLPLAKQEAREELIFLGFNSRNVKKYKKKENK